MENHSGLGEVFDLSRALNLESVDMIGSTSLYNVHVNIRLLLNLEELCFSDFQGTVESLKQLFIQILHDISCHRLLKSSKATYIFVVQGK